MSSALAQREPLVALVRGLAQEIASLGPERLGEAHEFLALIQRGVEGLEDVVTARLKEQALTHGHKTTEKGTHEVVLGSHLIRAIPTRTGTDPKRLEAKLRAKGHDPGVAMNAKITYEVNPDKLAKAVEGGLITQAEVDACKYDINYRVQVEVASDGR
jgi:hypothetical protein